MTICAVPGNARYKVPVSTLLTEVRTAYIKEHRLTELEIRIVKYLCHDLQMVLTLAGANPNELVHDIDLRLAALRGRLAASAAPYMQGVVLSAALKDCSFTFSAAEEAAALATYAPLIKEACDKALAQWDKFIPEAVEALTHRLRFDPKRKPTPLPVPKDGLQYRAPDVAAFFGAIPGHTDVECIAEWNEYVAIWDSFPAALKDLGISCFWQDDRVLSRLANKGKHLAKYAVWYADRPTSSVAVERAFGVLRAMEQMTRLGMHDEMVELSFKSRVNSWVVDRILHNIADNIAGTD